MSASIYVHAYLNILGDSVKVQEGAEMTMNVQVDREPPVRPEIIEKIYGSVRL